MIKLKNGDGEIFHLDREETLLSFSRYDAADMNVFRSALSACVLSGLDNIRNLITIARQQILEKQKPLPSISSAIVPAGTLFAAVGALTATIDQISRWVSFFYLMNKKEEEAAKREKELHEVKKNRRKIFQNTKDLYQCL